MTYWRVVENFHDFQAPVELGDWWDNVEMINSSFVFDTSRLKFRFRNKREDDSPIGDFCRWKGGFFFVSRRGYEALAEHFTRNGRVFPIKCGKLPYFIVTVDNEVDALDYERSIIERFDKYDDIERDLFRIKKIALKPDVQPELDIFRLKGKPTVAFEIIVSDSFKKKYEEIALTGLLFRSVIQ